MKIRQQISRLVPTFLKRIWRIRYEMNGLQSCQTLHCDPGSLNSIDNVILHEIFSSHEIELGWADTENRLEMFSIPDGTGGVNPGDRKAIYYLISVFRPSCVLEIGTHIGASTINIASALFAHQSPKEGKQAHLVSVDISDVNNSTLKPWLKHGTKRSPIEMVNKLGYGHFVEFITDTSLDYFSTCRRRFDFIFLDGDHSARAVYKEILAALNLLNNDGVILLHDYFPNLKPLWSNGSLIPGPFLATERLKDEGANLVVLPLGELPWPTKLKSNITSLALLLKN